MERRLVEISWGSLWRISLFAVLVAVFYLGRQVVLGLFLAIIISSGLEGAVDSLARRVRLPRSMGVILIFLLAALIIILVAYSVVPFVIVELNTVAATAGKSMTSSTSSLGFLMNLQTSQSASSFMKKISTQLFANGGTPLDFFSNTLGSLGLFVSVIASSFYLSLSRDGVERFIKIVTPPDYEPTALRIYERSRRKIGSWVRMQLVLSVIMGVLVWGGLALLRVPNAFLIGCLAAIFELIPFIGPIVSGAIGVVSALGISAGLAISTLIFFLVAQQFESNILVPILSKRSVDLHPVIVITALLIGAEVGGFLGMVIAVPAAGVFQEVIEEWSTKKRGIPLPSLE